MSGERLSFLPRPSVTEKTVVIGIGPVNLNVEDAFTRLAMKYHPDLGGTALKMHELLEARAAARKEVR
jgi:hypothetical protein